MKKSYGEGVASHTGPKPCAGAARAWAKRRQGYGRTGRKARPYRDHDASPLFVMIYDNIASRS
jgi:hypothetical protein